MAAVIVTTSISECHSLSDGPDPPQVMESQMSTDKMQTWTAVDQQRSREKC